ncbi:hypothetical protein JD969_07555 [Planctomycetota bacterium]|nr:hypothetical protein JD969_07555 [Planctomycetota bacterium]
MYLGTKTETYTGEDIEIHCPVCRKENVLCKPRLEIVTDTYMFFISIGHKRQTLMNCGACKVCLKSRVHFEKLHRYTADQLVGDIYPANGFSSACFALLALLISPVLFIGTIFIGISLLLCYWRKGWRLKMTYIALAIQVSTWIMFYFFGYIPLMNL